MTQRYTVGEPYPEHLLRGIRWDFAGQGVYSDRGAFEEAVQRHHEEEADRGGRAEPWRPGEVVLRWSRVLIGYDLMPAGEDEEEDQLADLPADGDVFFTAGELLFKLHNAVVEHLHDREKHRFEGLTFFMATEEGDPRYLLRQGWSDV